MSIRSDCLNALLTNLQAISSIKTVALGNDDFGGASGYLKSELPLAIIKVESETPSYETARYAYWKVSLSLFLYFLADTEDAQDREDLVAAVKNKIGEDPTLGERCTMCEVMGVVSSGAYPLYKETFSLEFKYERNIANA